MASQTRPQHLQPHPRRPPAHRSVSLRHSPSPLIKSVAQPKSNAFDSQVTERSSGGSASSPSSLKPLIGKDDSGESSNAEKWFEKSNNNASPNSTGYPENSPPFFIHNSSSGDTFGNQHRTTMDQPGAGHDLSRTNIIRFGTDNSSTEGFRGVIDDLTIENKKLKRKLKTYEKLQDSHLKDEKLFEVRVHGLPTAKKRELEDMLRKFAMGLSGQSAGELAANLYASAPSGLSLQKSGSSRTSNQNTDSAYASASASGQGSSGSDLHKNKFVGKSRQTIQSYLHDIPEGLLPQHAAAMTEKARKKLVVRRLEQIFAGKGAAGFGHQQPLQQQEVSHMAARADRASGDKGQMLYDEGSREARIMRVEKETQLDNNDEVTQHLDPASMVNETDFASNKGNDQRPTRPLDLDPHRAQVPADNIQYIRHLGFSPPGIDAMEPPADGHGWIYLNILANMAQLHTVNVTSDFIKKSIQDYSKKFELSADGRKVRWKGGKTVTKGSSDGADTPSVGADGSLGISSERGSPRKRIKLSRNGDSSGSETLTRSAMRNQPDARFSYTPLFHHRSSNDSSMSTSDEEDTNESSMPLLQGDSSGMTSSGVRTNSNKKSRRREAGPMIFYNNARFCTDLSGDTKTEEAMMYNAHLYHNVTTQAVGTEVEVQPADSPASETRGLLDKVVAFPDAMDLDDNPIPSEDELSFPPQSPLSNQAGKSRTTYELEASGIGGVYPADNFAINVESMHARLDNNTAPETVREGVPERYPERIARLLADQSNGRKRRSAFHKQIINTAHQELPPSQLPDAFCFMPADGDTSIDDESYDRDDMSISAGSQASDAPSAAPQPIAMDFTSDSEEDEDFDDGSSEGSLDLLATAREIDPEAIRRRELEYDANMAERLAEEIPAGSSAATAGGGSGFNSPASNPPTEDSDLARKMRREQRRAQRAESKPSLQKNKTSDSMVVNGRQDDDSMEPEE
ncbi:hypothetical protein MBLNU457_2303t1 [Dothideomycetes sp. NU457]